MTKPITTTRGLRFTIDCETLAQAAAVEAALQHAGIVTYRIALNADDEPEIKAKKGRHLVTAAIREAIQEAARSNPTATIPDLQRLTGLPHSSSTFARVLGRDHRAEKAAATPLDFLGTGTDGGRR